MTYSTPTKEEIRDYFFDKSNNAVKEKVETWFYHHGKSDEAKALLFTFWEDENLSPLEREETKIAFDKFVAKITNPEMENEPVVSRRKIWGKWIRQIAAILLLPIISISLYQLYQSTQTVQWVEDNVAYGNIKVKILPDGTKVWMNAGSKIIYPSEFKGDKRQIFFIGEAHFSVVKNEKKPFIIESNETQIEVLGTEFNLKSYFDDKHISVALLSGKVAFNYNNDREADERTVLTPGQQIDYNKTDHTLSREEFSIHEYSSWKDGKYCFKNEPLENITRQLERNFNVQIIIRNDTLKKIPFHMVFVNNETLDDMLKAIALDKRIKVKRSGAEIEIY